MSPRAYFRNFTVCGFKNVPIRLDMASMKVAFGVGNGALGSYFWWSLKHIIAVSSVCPNVQCPMIICFDLAVFSFSSLLC